MTGKCTILAVGANRRNLELLTQVLEERGYRTVAGVSVEEFDRILDETEIALALVDVAGFDSRIWNSCERLRRDGVPFFLISRQAGPDLQRESLARGARGGMTKPLRIGDLLATIETLLEQPT